MTLNWYCKVSVFTVSSYLSLTLPYLSGQNVNCAHSYNVEKKYVWRVCMISRNWRERILRKKRTTYRILRNWGRTENFSFLSKILILSILSIIVPCLNPHFHGQPFSLSLFALSLSLITNPPYCWRFNVYFQLSDTARSRGKHKEMQLVLPLGHVPDDAVPY